MSVETTTTDNLLTITVTGNLTAAEILAVANEHYRNGIVKHVIWDLSNGSLTLLNTIAFRRIASATKVISDAGFRKGGKTAYVGDSALEYGLMRMYVAIAESLDVPVKYFVFKTLDEAREWINS